MNIAVIDGQEVVLATATMLKAGANKGATGENAIVQNMSEMDIVVGSVNIIVAHSMMGELTLLMAEAIGKSKARKFLLPINRCGVTMIGVESRPLPRLVEALLMQINEMGERKMQNDLKELEALLNYLINHNEDHAQEIVELAVKAKEMGKEEVNNNLAKGVEYLKYSNEMLKKALQLLRDDGGEIRP